MATPNPNLIYRTDQSGSLTYAQLDGNFAYLSQSIAAITTPESASYAATASYVETAQTASYFSGTVENAATASYIDAANVDGQVASASYALTASYVENAQTASYVLNAISASFATTASFSSFAALANQAASPFVSATTNNIDYGVAFVLSATPGYTTLYRAAGLTFNPTSSLTRATNLIATGSLFGTSSWANNATTASYVLNAVSASFASTASFVPTLKASSASVASFGGRPYSASVTFGTAYPNNLYSVTVTGEDSRAWSISSKTSTGFTIDTNSSTLLTGPVYWIATPFNL